MIAHLQSPWNQDADYRPGDPVNLIVPQLDDFNGQLHCLLGGTTSTPRALLVHFPDILLGGTRVAGSTQCTRHGYLEERFSNGNGTNAPCTKGNMYHALFQTALSKNLRMATVLEQHAREISAAHPADLLDSNMSEFQAFTYLKDSIPKMISMLNKFQRSEPIPSAVLSTGYIAGVEHHRRVCIPEVLDIEEYIAAPKFGLKGFIDASIKLKLLPGDAHARNQQQQQQQQQQGPFSIVGKTANNTINNGEVVVVAPLELKTGFSRPSDEAQVLLYLLGMEERYGHPLEWGLLINSNPQCETPQRLVARQDSLISALMAARNRLASSLARGTLPPLADSKSNCARCYSKRECMLTHAAIEHRSSENNESLDDFMQGMYPGKERDTLTVAYQSETAHLTRNDKEFLSKWADLLNLEATGAATQRPEIWAMTGKDREAAGRCVTALTIVSMKKSEGANSVLYTFAKINGGEIIQCPFPAGEMLMLGVDGRHAGVGRGHLHDCTATTLTVSMEKELREGLLFPHGRLAVKSSACCDPGISWRLDKEEVGTTTPRMRSFLYSLFAHSASSGGVEEPVSSRAAKLRKLIVDLAPPTPPLLSSLPLSSSSSPSAPLEAVLGREISRLKLNAQQASAVRAAVTTEDYTLVLGMPGAGKTTAVVAMLRVLALTGKRVLLTSYTNSAVDNVLLKLAEIATTATKGGEKSGEEDVPFVRVGRAGRVAPALLPWTPGGDRYKAETAGQLAQLVDDVKIWGVSALGVTDALIRRREFDVCIVDEAGQITLPATLGPLLRARAFVLVGDPHQLPPLVTNEAAVDGGLSEPLFARLAAAHPSAVVALPVQYRMAEDIQVLPNLLMYEGQLRCGCSQVAMAELKLPHWPLLSDFNGGGGGDGDCAAPISICGLSITASGQQQQQERHPSHHQFAGNENLKTAWVHAALSPENRVVFLDTSAMPAPEIKAGETITNPREAEIALTLVNAAVRAGLPAAAVGLISPYNRQVSLLGKMMRGAGVGDAECLTIDKAQGRDKDFIIVSLVKSNAERETGKLLTDSRRVNVAITRAKAKLVLIGDGRTLRALPLFEKILVECEKRGWVVPVPPLHD